MSRSKRGDSGLSFVFAVNKPTDFTSHDVVDAVRRATGERRVGHGGTLDPFATGVLPIMIGPAARLASYFDLCQKAYVAKNEFGKATDTDDLTGNVIMTKEVAKCVSKGARHRLYRQDFAKEILANFIGEIEQVPPKYSAIKVGGKKSYEVARGGGELEIPKRRVKVFEAELLNIEENEAKDAPVWEVRFVVGSGTYIRSIARDAGLLADSCAFVSRLRRTRVGGLSLDESVELEDLGATDNWSELAVDPASILSLAPIIVDPREEKLVSCGNAISAKGRGLDFEQYGDKPVLIATDEKILAVYKYDAKSEKLKADTVFAKGILR